MSLAGVLACPLCHGSLADLACTACGRTFAVRGGVADLTPDPPPDLDVRSRWGLWETLQANGERAYGIDPPSSLSVGERPDARAFAEFAELGQGRVLDVGCGPQALPSYADGVGERFAGIDPLLGQQPRAFDFVMGIAEYLPFRDRCFDRVLFATSLDHVLSPARTLSEAYRVTRPGGAVAVWLGEQPPPPTLRDRVGVAARMISRGEVGAVVQRVRAAVRHEQQHVVTVRTPAAAMTFEVPAGAVDAFHVAHPDAATVTGWLRDAGLTVEAVQRPLPGHCFLRARRR